jgi:2-polyprenyl-6-methoxyphenol hydroxylase-like FAD-dependent oxidoreductase
MEGICHMSDLHVLVVGAGLGGLALAQGLQRAGIAVTVVERDSSLTARRQGYRLHIDAEGRDALVRVLPPASAALFFATAGVPSPRFTVLDHRLGHVTTQEAGPAGVLPDNLAVDRLVLRRILLSGVEDRVVFGKELQHFVEDDGGVTAFFTDGSPARRDVLVGADGVGSAVRRQHLPHARIVDTGVWQIYGSVPLDQHTHALFDEHMRGIFTVISGADGALLGVAPVEFPEPPHEYEADMTAHGFAAVLTGARNGERFLGQDPLPTA